MEMIVKPAYQFSVLISLLLIFILETEAPAQTKSATDTVYLKMAVPMRIFDDLTRKDAQFAIDMWSREFVQSIEKTTNKHFIVSSSFLENKYKQVDFSESKKYDILLLNALDFLDFNLEDDWQPTVLTGSRGHFPEEYVVLCKKGNKIKNIRDLKGKTVVFLKNQNARIILFWLHNLFRTKHLGEPEHYFHSLEMISKESKAVLSVFFNRADACIVGYNSFQTMTQLNPQLKQDLLIVLKSPPFARGIVCIKKTLTSEIKQIITHAVFQLPQTNRGKQILAYFGQSILIPFNPKYLDSFRKILQMEKHRHKK